MKKAASYLLADVTAWQTCESEDGHLERFVTTHQEWEKLLVEHRWLLQTLDFGTFTASHYKQYRLHTNDVLPIESISNKHELQIHDLAIESLHPDAASGFDNALNNALLGRFPLRQWHAFDEFQLFVVLN